MRDGEDHQLHRRGLGGGGRTAGCVPSRAFCEASNTRVFKWLIAGAPCGRNSAEEEGGERGQHCSKVQKTGEAYVKVPRSLLEQAA
jgi:hypothetical protein